MPQARRHGIRIKDGSINKSNDDRLVHLDIPRAGSRRNERYSQSFPCLSKWSRTGLSLENGISKEHRNIENGKCSSRAFNECRSFTEAILTFFDFFMLFQTRAIIAL